MFNQHVGVDSNSPIDIHFTYPKDGDLHFSLKDKISKEGEERYENVFSDHFRRKVITPSGKTIIEQKRSDDNPSWHQLMPRYRPAPLLDYFTQPIRFCFASTNIPIFEGRVAASALDRLPKESAVSSSEPLISLSALGSGTVHISACLLGHLAEPVWPNSEIMWSLKDESAFPHIHLFAMFTPKKTPNQAPDPTAPSGSGSA